MPFSKDHNRGKETHGANERGLAGAIQNWRSATEHGTKEEQAKYAFSVVAHLGERNRKLNDLIAEGALNKDEAEAIRRDSQNI